MDNKEIIKLKLTQLLTENENKFLIESVKNKVNPFNISDNQNWFESILIECNISDIKEGLIKSYEYDFVVSRLSKYGNVIENRENNQIFLKVKDKDNLQHIINHINTLGYFISQYKILENNKEISSENYIDYKSYNDVLPKLKDTNELWLVIEPKFNSYIDSDNIDFIYHITEKNNLYRIKEQGLVPRSNSKKVHHPDRIYITIEFNLLNDILKGFISHDKDINDFIILKIDYKLAGKPKLYNDPNYFRRGYYIIDNIRPSAIMDTLTTNNLINN